MTPDWYFAAEEACAEEHNPAEYDGREWDALTDEEREEAIHDHIWGCADALNDAQEG